MATKAQITANRQNAQKSTGPKTDAGKARARFNGVTHGLRAEQIVLDWEDVEDFNSLKQQWHQDFNPPTAARQALVDQIVAAEWRLRRGTLYETARLNEVGRQAIEAHETRARAEAQGWLRALSQNPRAVMAKLAMSYEGVEAVHDAWLALLDATTTPEDWNHPEKHGMMLIHLLGLEKLGEEPWMISIHHDMTDLFHYNIVTTVEDFKKRLLPEYADEARDRIRAFIKAELVTVSARLAMMPDQKTRRAAIANRAILDGCPEEKNLLRYQAHHDRAFNSALNQLKSLTKSDLDLAGWVVEDEAPTEPNFDATPEPETASVPSEVVAKAAPVVRAPKSKPTKPAKAPNEPNPPAPLALPVPFNSELEGPMMVAEVGIEVDSGLSDR